MLTHLAISGHFDLPTPGSDALPSCGTLTLDVTKRNEMTMRLDTLEGSSISDAVQRVGVAGLACP
jgi:hypothetical protein